MLLPPSLTELFENNAPYGDFLALFERCPGLIHSQDDFGRTPLYLASWHNRDDVVKALLQAGADKDKAKKKGDGATPLCIAAHQGHIDVVKALLEAHADKDKATDDGSTPLCIAAQKGHTEIVNALLEAHADKDKAMHKGATPLYFAAQNGHIDVVKALLGAHADTDKATDDGATPLCIAAHQGHIDVVKALLEAHADKDKARGDGITPLSFAAQHGHIDVVNTLLQAGVDKDKAMHNGATPLFIAAQQGHTEVVKALLEAGANIHLRWKSKNLTPLHAAALGNNKECFELLLEHPEVTTGMLADIIIDMNAPEAFRLQATTELEKRLEFASEETKRAWPICPITQTFIIEPVMGTDGCCYEKSSITKWVNEHKTSPHSRQPMTVNNLIKPNYLVDWIEGSFKQLDEAFFASNTSPKDLSSEMDLSSDTPVSREDLANHRARFFENKRKSNEHNPHQERPRNEYKRTPA